MISLPNGCSCSEISVHPSNWKKVTASTKQQWYIHYRFYDPRVPKPKLVIIKGMNHLAGLEHRREATRILIDNELELLMSRGYNPITKQFTSSAEASAGVSTCTGLIAALRYAMEKVTCTPETKIDIRSVIKYVEQAAEYLRLANEPVSTIRKRHIKQILEQCKKLKARWTAATFNHYRNYLSLLFRELCEQEAIEFNPVRDLAKQKGVRRIRKVLTQEERKRVQDLLEKERPEFLRFVQIFFHSGARECELLRLRGADVDLKKQVYTRTVKKGRQHIEVITPIKDVALPYWSAVMSTCRPEDFVFSEGLRPGQRMIRREQVTRRWKRHIKDRLGIDADFYSLKHLNLDETAAALSIQEAALMAGHTTPVITIAHYAVNEKERQREKLKKVNNSFS